MSTAQALPSSDPRYFSQFKTEIQNGLRTGTDCEGNPKKYVPYRVLVDYWTPQNIADILRQHLGERAEYIFRKDVQEKYLRGLSILAFASTSRKAYIDELPLLVNATVDDDRLASEEPEKCLSPDAWGVFKNLRWMFCPISLEYDGSLRGSLLHPHRIFPGQIRTPESLGRSEIERGRRHPDAEFQFLEPEGSKHSGKAPERLTGMAVIKSYPAAARDSWSNETVFFGRSEQSRRRPDNIVRCLGFYSCDSSTKGLRHNIVLEYARRGSLQEFLTVETPPRTAGDISAFWRSIVPFLCGLEYIHNRDHSHEEVAGVHQDVKPSNLLVFPGPKGRFDFVLKICDFGLGTTKGTPASLGPHRDGSSEFSSPEKFFGNAVEHRAHPMTDMWAAACVILDMAAWVRNDFEGQEQFKRLRHDEIELTAHDMYRRGHRYCYHNGSSALDCVLHASTSLAGVDQLTQAIVKEVVESIFQKPSRERLTAGDLLRALRQVISAAENRLSTVHPRVNSPILPPTSNRNLYPLSPGKNVSKRSTHQRVLAEVLSARMKHNGATHEPGKTPESASKLSYLGHLSPPSSQQDSTSHSGRGLLESEDLEDSSTIPTSLSLYPVSRYDDRSERSVPAQFFNFGSGDQLELDTEDVRSVKSAEDDIQSMAGSQPELMITAANYIVKKLLQDADLQEIYHKARQSMSQGKFVRNHRRLLKRFCLNLRDEGHNPKQELAMDFLRLRSSRTRISTQIWSHFGLLEGSTKEKITAALKEEDDKTYIIDRFLEERGLRMTALNFLESRAIGDSNSNDSGDSDDNEHVPPLEESLDTALIAEYLVSGRAFGAYKVDIRDFVFGRPSSTRITEYEQSKQQDREYSADRQKEKDKVEHYQCPSPRAMTTVKLTGQPVAGIGPAPLQVQYEIGVKGRASLFCHGLKKHIERLMGRSLCWEPLCQPENEVEPGFTRIYSEFSCGWKHYVDMKTCDAKVYFPKLSREVCACHCSFLHCQCYCRRRCCHPAVFLRNTTLAQCFDSALSLAGKTHSSGGSIPTVDEAAGQSQLESKSAANNEISSISHSELKRPHKPANCENEAPSEMTTTEQRDRRKPVLFLTVDANPGRQDDCMRSVPQGSSDGETLSDLYATYCELRPSWLWAPIGIKFHRFFTFLYDQERNMHRIELIRNEECYPEEGHADYEAYKFQPRPWPKRLPFPRGEILHYLQHPRNCAHTSRLNQKLPIRVADIAKLSSDGLTGPAFEAFGVHVEQTLRASIMGLFLLLIFLSVFGSTVWFIPVWLNSHPGDLQNATVPIVVGTAIFMGVTSIALVILFVRYPATH